VSLSNSIIDKVLGIVAAVAAPTTALLVHAGTISSLEAVDISSIIAALVVGYHGSTAVHAAVVGSATSPADLTTVPVAPTVAPTVTPSGVSDI
jgi:hypothetical protein